MRHALLQRFGHGLLVLWAAFTLSFVLLQVLPGDAVLIKFQNPDLGLSPAQIKEMRVAYGADSPLWQQYAHTLLAMLHGDFGYSLQAGVPVSELIASNLPDTLSLALPAFVLAVLLAFALAFASRLPGLRWLSNTIQSVPVLFISLPTFWLGIALIQLFSFQLRLIPVINPSPLQGLILPIVTVAILTKLEILLVIIGGVFVIETLSVILQVISFKTTGKRIFKMSPLHHHYELVGWSEWRVVVTFWTAGLLLAVLGIYIEVWL